MKDTFKDRKRSYIVKWLMKQDKMNTEVAAMALDVSTAYFNNKLTRNSFSFEDIIRVAYAAGYKICFIPIANKERPQYTVNIDWYFENDEITKKLDFISERHYREKLQQYETLKTELAEMRKQYGFKD